MKKILFLLLLPFLVACSSEILPESHGVEGSVASHEVSLENALKRVEPLFSSIGGKTRSGLKVSSVEYVTAPRRTRSIVSVRHGRSGLRQIMNMRAGTGSIMKRSLSLILVLWGFTSN